MNRKELIEIFKDNLDESFYCDDYWNTQDDDEFLESFIVEIFGFCSCGCLMSMGVRFLNDILNCYHKEEEEKDLSPYLHFEEAMKVCKEDDNICDFILHFLDSCELTEHGSSVYGSWLTDKGIVLKSALNEYFTDKEEVK